MKKLILAIKNMDELAAKFVFQGMRALISIVFVTLMVYISNIVLNPLSQTTCNIEHMLMSTTSFTFVEILLSGVLVNFLSKFFQMNEK